MHHYFFFKLQHTIKQFIQCRMDMCRKIKLFYLIESVGPSNHPVWPNYNYLSKLHITLYTDSSTLNVIEFVTEETRQDTEYGIGPI